MKPTRIQGQPSWRFASDKVDAAVTQQGGHLGPVRFYLPRGTVQLFSVAPWAEEKSAAKIIPLLQSLRGDFFCMPFGGSGSKGLYRGEDYPAHGEVASLPWKFESLEKTKSETTLRLSMNLKVRRGHVEKTVRLRKGETLLYCRHTVSGMSGKMCFGQHATLKFPDAPGSGLISTSPMTFGQVLPVPFEKSHEGGYSALKMGAEFSRLDRVPAMDGTMADISRYPARRGFEDLAMVTHQAADDFAWVAAVFPAQGYVWFALKDPRILRSTTFWMSNGGRHYAPWNGRHVSVIGLEDVTAYFALGLSDSVRPNPVSRRGIATHLDLKASVPLVVNYIMGVAAIPKNFGRVKTITRESGGVILKSTSGRIIHTSVDTTFLYAKDT
jgi:hypothetical protein